MKPLWKVIIVLALMGQMYLVFWTMRLRYISQYADVKYVGFRLNGGRLGNQLFHLITGYGIAKTLNRIHYLPFSDHLKPHVQKYLDIFKKVFPHLEETYVHAQNVTNETVVPFAGSCCVYDDPHRLLNHPAKYLLLDFYFGQNPRYFDKYIDDVRRVLSFSSYIRREGNYIVDSLKIKRNSRTCIHVRRTDFIERNISTDVNQAVKAANSIARRVGTSEFMIFGDDQTFMKQLGDVIIKQGKWKKDAVMVSKYSEPIDLYLSSQLCRSFLISAVTSTFGWWLAFFIQDQNAVFYVSDDRKHGDKLVSKELFMKSWRKI